MSKKNPVYVWAKQRSSVVHYFSNIERVHTSTRDDPKVFLRLACNKMIPAPNGAEPTWAMSEHWPKTLDDRNVCSRCTNAGGPFKL